MNIDWEAQNDGVYKLIPPPYGTVVITQLGLVLMCKGTYETLSKEPIKCADCIHFDSSRNSKCNLSQMRVNGEDYCSKGRTK